MAGIIDGEGSIYVTPRARYVSPRVQITNTEMELLVPIQIAFGGCIYEKRPSKNDIIKRRKKCYALMLSGNCAIGILKEVLPYLKSLRKIEVAKLAVEYWDGRRPMMPGVKLTPNDLQRMKDYQDRIKSANRSHHTFK